MISSTSDSINIRIYIDEALHAYFRWADLLAIQSYTWGERYYAVEITLKGAVLTLEYENKATWQAVLSILNKEL